MRFIKELSQLELGILITILIGILTTGVFVIYEHEVNRFTLVYIYPESYEYPPFATNIDYIYGIQSFETYEVEYLAQIRLDGRVLKEEKITLPPHEVYESRNTVDISNVTRFPVKIEFHVTSSIKEYQAHFWVDRPNQLFPY